jgi:hypothetical protein
MGLGAPQVTGDVDLAAGQEVGEYVIEEKIGQGGFGAVFRATHPLIDKLAAVKVLSRTYSADPEIVSRFIAEARAVNQIRHRHIIDIFSFRELEDGRSYYVLEFLEGEPLDVCLESGALEQAAGIPPSRASQPVITPPHGVPVQRASSQDLRRASSQDGRRASSQGDKRISSRGGSALSDTMAAAPARRPRW